MGQSTDAILCWGIHIGETPWEDDAEFAGFDNPYDDGCIAYFLTGVKGLGWMEVRDALKASGIEIRRHCSGEYPMYILTLSESCKVANRGYPQEVPSNFLDVPKRWVEMLNGACEKLSIENPEPKWILCSYWF